VVVDSAGNLYIADINNHRIRKVDAATHNISSVAGNGSQGYNGDGIPATSASLNDPTGVAVDSAGNVYIADTDNVRIRKVEAATGAISTVVGNGLADFSGDGGPPTGASLEYPQSLTVDSAGNLYIADTANWRIRGVFQETPNISTVDSGGGRSASANYTMVSSLGGIGGTSAAPSPPVTVDFGSIGQLQALRGF
jgi:sugar lactone lactonase YvrE